MNRPLELTRKQAEQLGVVGARPRRPPNPAGRPRTPAIERFWPKVNKNGPLQPDGSRCWVWTGAPGRGGYGAFHDGNRQISAHRFSYQHFKGPLYKGECACHTCDNPPCVNPAHLFRGTYSDNERDKVAKGRANNVLVQRMRAKTHCPHGHEFTPENTAIDGNKRACRTCRRTYERDLYRRRSALREEDTWAATQTEVINGEQRRVLTLCIAAAPRTKKNSTRVVWTKQGPRQVQSKAYYQFLDNVRAAVLPRRQALRLPLPVGRYQIDAQFYCDSNRSDLINLQQALADALEKCGVVTNDQQFEAWGDSRRHVDKKRPRVEITIRPMV